MTTLDTLLGAMLPAPSLPGARCRGRPHLFDPPASGEDPAVVAQRHAQALSLCGGCPALAPCQRWVSSLTPAKRPEGIVAGKLITARRRKSA